MSLLALTLAGFGIGCDGQDRAVVLPGRDASAMGDLSVIASCPHDLPAACPTPAPSWSGNSSSDSVDGGVQAIINARCVPCHSAGGLAFDRPFTTYAGVYKIHGDVLDQIYSCYMPPPDAGALDATQRQALLGWLVCGAPNN